MLLLFWKTFKNIYFKLFHTCDCLYQVSFTHTSIILPNTIDSLGINSSSLAVLTKVCNDQNKSQLDSAISNE